MHTQAGSYREVAEFVVEDVELFGNVLELLFHLNHAGGHQALGEKAVEDLLNDLVLRRYRQLLLSKNWLLLLLVLGSVVDKWLGRLVRIHARQRRWRHGRIHVLHGRRRGGAHVGLVVGGDVGGSCWLVNVGREHVLGVCSMRSCSLLEEKKALP